MNSNMLLRHNVVKLIRRYLEDIHGFVEVLSSRFIIWIFESIAHRTLVVGIWYPVLIFTFFVHKVDWNSNTVKIHTRRCPGLFSSIKNPGI